MIERATIHMKETFFISDDVLKMGFAFFFSIILFFRVSKKNITFPLLMTIKNQKHKYTYQNLVF